MGSLAALVGIGVVFYEAIISGAESSIEAARVEA
jgi:hypothetical protein